MLEVTTSGGAQALPAQKRAKHGEQQHNDQQHSSSSSVLRRAVNLASFQGAFQLMHSAADASDSPHATHKHVPKKYQMLMVRPTLRACVRACVCVCVCVCVWRDNRSSVVKGVCFCFPWGLAAGAARVPVCERGASTGGTGAARFPF